MNPTHPTISVLLPHVKTYGGVRRYIEMGNEFTRRGYDYTIFTTDGLPPDWISYSGQVRPISDISQSMDILICGDVGMLPRFAELKARLKIMNLLGSRFAERYRAYHSSEMVVVGNSVEWKKYLPGVPGYTIAGAVNSRLFKPMRTDRGGTPFRVICFGRWRKDWKGTRLVVRAMRRIRPRKDYLLVMFDSEPIRKPCFMRCEVHHGLTQEQLAGLYNTADVFVSAERGAGWSNTSAEAMACGVPLVCTDSGTQDFAVNGETAIVVPHDDVDAIAANVRRLREDDELRGRLIENGLRKIAEFTWSSLCDKFEGLFREKGLG